MNKAQLVLAAQQEVLQDLLKPDNANAGAYERFATSILNSTIITKAQELGVELDLSWTTHIDSNTGVEVP